MSRPATPAAGGHRARDYRLLLVQGSAVKLAGAVAGAAVVLPFLCTALGGSVLVAGLLVPLSTVGTIAGNAVGPPLMRRRGGNRGWVVTSTVLSALLVLAVAALGLGERHGPVLVSTVFVAAAVLGGAVAGLGGLAYTDLLGVALPRRRRSALLFTRSALGGVLAVAVALGTARVFAGRDALTGHLALVWVAGGVLVAAALSSRFVVADSRPSGDEALTVRSSVRAGVVAVRDLTWYRRYLLVQSVLLSVGFGTSFYAIHAATEHAGEPGSLSAVVVASAAGLVLGALVWERVLARFGFRALFVLGAATGTIAATVSAATHFVGGQVVATHAVVLLLATLAAQSVTVGRRAYLLDRCPVADRPTLFSFARIAVGALGGLLAAGLGVLAEVHGAVWPTVVLVALNALAVSAALLSPRPSRAPGD